MKPSIENPPAPPAPLAVIASMRSRLLMMVAAVGTIADELETAEEILRNPAGLPVDGAAFEACLREAIDAATLLPDQAEELVTVMESLADIAADIVARAAAAQHIARTYGGAEPFR